MNYRGESKVENEVKLDFPQGWSQSLWWIKTFKSSTPRRLNVNKPQLPFSGFYRWPFTTTNPSVGVELYVVNLRPNSTDSQSRVNHNATIIEAVTRLLCHCCSGWRRQANAGAGPSYSREPVTSRQHLVPFQAQIPSLTLKHGRKLALGPVHHEDGHPRSSDKRQSGKRRDGFLFSRENKLYIPDTRFGFSFLLCTYQGWRIENFKII